MSTRAQRTAAGVAAGLFATVAHARPDLIAYDGFDIGPRLNLAGASGGAGWASSWTNMGTLLTSVSATGLAYSGVPAAPGAAVTEPGVLPDIADYNREWTPVTLPPERVYVSFLLRADEGYGTFFGLELGVPPHAVHVGAPVGYYVYGLTLGEGLIVPTNIPVVPGQTAFLVLEIGLVPQTSLGTYKLYVNPNARAAQPLFPTLQAALPGVSALPAGVRIKGDGGYTTDEIRIGLTWESVVGAGCYADCNADGALTIADFACFQNAIIAGDPYADCNRSKSLTAADLACFQATFAAGCP